MTHSNSLPASEPVCPVDFPVIVYFDGICGFCNASVNFLMRHDPEGKLAYAPLQGETARQRLLPEEIAELNTMVISIGDQTFRRSAAVVRVLWTLGGGWSVLGTLLWLVPPPVRNLGYRIVAKYRYQIFGKQETCRLPQPDEQSRLLP